MEEYLFQECMDKFRQVSRTDLEKIITFMAITMAGLAAAEPVDVTHSKININNVVEIRNKAFHFISDLCDYNRLFMCAIVMYMAINELSTVYNNIDRINWDEL